jgi:hypothetical protein
VHSSYRGYNKRSAAGAENAQCADKSTAGTDSDFIASAAGRALPTPSGTVITVDLRCLTIKFEGYAGLVPERRLDHGLSRALECSPIRFF